MEHGDDLFGLSVIRLWKPNAVVNQALFSVAPLITARVCSKWRSLSSLR
jgi:hypothetical protein